MAALRLSELTSRARAYQKPRESKVPGSAASEAGGVDTEIKQLAIADIKLRSNRKVGDIQPLADSIRESGLINPITVDQDYNLLAGYHRLAACKSLGLATIAASIVQVDSDHARLLSIDENLIRNELSKLDRAYLLAERKELYERLHPQTQHGAPPGGRGNQHKVVSPQVEDLPESFTRNTAKKVGRSRQTVEREVALAALKPLDKEIREAGIENNQAELLKLNKVATTDTEKARKALDLVVQGKAKNLRAAAWRLGVEEQREAIEAAAPELPSGEYDCIVIDPPWDYGTAYSEGRQAANPYPSMSLDDIRALEIPAAQDCILWLWTTQSFLPAAFDLLKAWGFEYRTTLVWNKQRFGLGSLLRIQCEFCLVAFRGKPKWLSNNTRDYLEEKSREHSRKPDGFYSLVEQCCAGRRLDYFSREQRPGWAAFGNNTAEFNGGGEGGCRNAA